MKTLQKQATNSRQRGLMSRLFHSIARLFHPEEVEITFMKKGSGTTYTYTVVDHHHAV